MSISTRALPEERRLGAFLGFINEALFDTAIRPFGKGGLLAESRSISRKPLSVMTFSSNEHLLDRTASMVTESPKSSIFVSAMISGSATYYAGNESHLVMPSEVLL